MRSLCQKKELFLFQYCVLWMQMSGYCLQSLSEMIAILDCGSWLQLNSLWYYLFGQIYICLFFLLSSKLLPKHTQFVKPYQSRVLFLTLSLTPLLHPSSGMLPSHTLNHTCIPGRNVAPCAWSLLEFHTTSVVGFFVVMAERHLFLPPPFFSIFLPPF